MPIKASAGGKSVVIEARRPSWVDMKRYYPAHELDSNGVYRKIGGPALDLVGKKEYENTCAARMSYALNRSGLKLRPNGGGSVLGADGGNYWLRVAELMPELDRRFKGADAELRLPMIPANLVKNTPAMQNIYIQRRRAGEKFIEEKLAGKKGIIVFNVTNFGGPTGHFTLWDGSDRSLAYAAGRDTSDANNHYYFWLTELNDDDTLTQTSLVKFWELK